MHHVIMDHLDAEAIAEVNGVMTMVQTLRIGIAIGVGFNRTDKTHADRRCVAFGDLQHVFSALAVIKPGGQRNARWNRRSGASRLLSVGQKESRPEAAKAGRYQRDN